MTTRQQQTAWQKAKETLANFERRAKRRREETAERQKGRDRAHAQYLDPHSPMSILPPLDGSNPERHRSRRLGEDQVGPEPGPFGHQHPGMKY